MNCIYRADFFLKNHCHFHIGADMGQYEIHKRFYTLPGNCHYTNVFGEGGQGMDLAGKQIQVVILGHSG